MFGCINRATYDSSQNEFVDQQTAKLGQDTQTSHGLNIKNYNDEYEITNLDLRPNRGSHLPEQLYPEINSIKKEISQEDIIDNRLTLQTDEVRREHVYQ